MITIRKKTLGAIWTILVFEKSLSQTQKQGDNTEEMICMFYTLQAQNKVIQTNGFTWFPKMNHVISILHFLLTTNEV